MVKVRLFGVFRLDSGVKELDTDAGSVRELLPLIIRESKRINPKNTMTVKDLKGCIISVNGRQVGLEAKLSDGDDVVLVPAVAGG
jgi:molybdopterin converting factor small subunit